MTTASKALIYQQALNKLDEFWDMVIENKDLFDLGIATNYLDKNGDCLVIDEALDEINKVLKNELIFLEEEALQKWNRSII